MCLRHHAFKPCLIGCDHWHLITVGEPRLSDNFQTGLVEVSYERKVAKSRAKKKRSVTTTALQTEQLECEADPRIDYRSRLINLLSEVERIGRAD